MYMHTVFAHCYCIKDLMGVLSRVDCNKRPTRTLRHKKEIIVQKYVNMQLLIMPITITYGKRVGKNTTDIKNAPIFVITIKTELSTFVLNKYMKILSFLTHL